MQYLSKCCDCGKEVTGTYKRKYCDRCLKRHLAINFREKVKRLETEFIPYEKKCSICSKTFTVTNYHGQSKKYCSECKKKARHLKKVKPKNNSGLVAVAASIVGKSYGIFVADNFNNPHFDEYVLELVKENRPDLLEDKNEIKNQ